MWAQNNTGIISGRITDPSGSVVPGAKITIVETETNSASDSVSNSDGLFRVPSLKDLTFKGLYDPEPCHPPKK